MILNFDENSPLLGSVPVNDGAYWRSRLQQVFVQITPVTLTAAATASVISTVGGLGLPTIPAGFMNRVGATLNVQFGGYVTTPGSSAGNLTLGIYLGGSCVATTPATAFAVSQTKIGYFGECRLTTLTVGSSGTIQATGVVCLSSLSAVLDPCFTNGTTIGTQVPQTPPTVNFTTALAVDIQSVLSAATCTLVHTNTTILLDF